ncbi:Six-hairpin glycosidase-like protein [Yarrowia lipolytica]|uniref:Mannosyl-oligosaccharide glucosidase n=2 Tax=Yarrowia lipolytica TaxID=4952 RepID=Q6CFZ0_YARLI|nr:YALI0B02332p [Yarrowia lipolytica CLIB122]AOW01120.1 hypothetical protein YALI1_B03644g [Yarrowia lipolytica]KAB8285233.1 Six-hairpin glycosidase-like protein [Yarrowia lipolytica]KAE8174857.1 Six-hairpin glycosidase-like protein [Yarrowia lipolytica]KAJ8052014.1 Six-hairpin glycosidase-like protein [Yarrowia lipolytica]RDW24513.1 Six-hairpin glycosidase-like protein [Yarrowia lipolytica]|eukprot:XP_500422.1 YALI0B02332p [Yarrowia lipolytica CLIB122]
MVVHNGKEVLSVEEKRLAQDRERKVYWKRWGTYVSERQWATVREDYSANGDAWSYFPHNEARSRTYRWGEDGLAGVSDNHQLFCLSFAFWNEKDDFLKERLFGLTNNQGNHGEDVKELYYYVDNTPTHSYTKYLYKYPQRKFPYQKLIDENAKRDRLQPEYEIQDTGVFDDDRYFDIFIEMAKDAENPEEMNFRITAWNRGPEPAPLHIVPQAWYRNTWAWGLVSEKDKPIPSLTKVGEDLIETQHHTQGKRHLRFANSPGFENHESEDDVAPKLLFTDNETNKAKLYGCKAPEAPKYCKDGFHEYIVDDNKDAVNPKETGTKAGAWYAFDQGDGIPPGDFVTVRFKFTNNDDIAQEIFDEEAFDEVFDKRGEEADDFYFNVNPMPIADDLRNIQRQALAGMLWTKQFYHFVYSQWAEGDPANPPPPPERANVRNQGWSHLYIDDILSMPDVWEYPFFAAWDTAFHCIPLAMIDPEFAKKQLDLLTREWYMHPNGQVPAYEWNFSDVNPPVHAWSALRTFKIERKMYGREDIDFLERVFQKLLLNFTWWVNRKDFDGKNVFQGGFLGLDNIGLFNRSEPLPTGGTLEQADATGWMGFFCLQMLSIALELAKHRFVYEDIASKFFEHFLLIADAMTFKSGDGTEHGLWNENDGFYYDAISYGGPYSQQIPVRSLVGLIPLFATITLEPEVLNRFGSFTKRLSWFVENRGEISSRNIASMSKRGQGERLLLSLVNKERLVKILEKMLDENEFLSEYGIRSLSKYHKDHPYSMDVHGQTYTVDYVPGDSNSPMFGGNSNWRGPIWFPTTFLLIESLQRYYLYYGDTLKVECPTGSGNYMNLAKVAEEIQHRLIHIFAADENGKRAFNGDNDKFNNDPNFKDYILFHEFFEADTGRGLGTQHQNGWTSLVAKLIYDVGVSCRMPRTPKTPGGAAQHFLDDDDYFSRGKKKPAKLKRRRSVKSIRSDKSDTESVHSVDGEPQESNEPTGKKDDDFNEEEHEKNQHLAEHIRKALHKFQIGDGEQDDI